jgi:hypothetical protein
LLRLLADRLALAKALVSERHLDRALDRCAPVSVLLREPNAAARIEAARAHATPLTRDLIARERLFR